MKRGGVKRLKNQIPSSKASPLFIRRVTRSYVPLLPVQIHLELSCSICSHRTTFFRQRLLTGSGSQASGGSLLDHVLSPSPTRIEANRCGIPPAVVRTM